MIQIENQTKYGVTKEANCEFYNTSFKKCLKDNNIKMYSVHSEEKSVADERFIRTLKTKIYKYVTSISKSVYIYILDNILNGYNDTYHRKIKMKPVDVKDNTYIVFKKGVNDKDPKFKVGEILSLKLANM